MHTVTQTSLYGKDLLTLKGLSEQDINALLAEAGELKRNKIQPIFQGKTLAMIFEKSSTRTRVSFEAGMAQLGGSALFLSQKICSWDAVRLLLIRQKCCQAMWMPS